VCLGASKKKEYENRYYIETLDRSDQDLDIDILDEHYQCGNMTMSKTTHQNIV